MVAVAGRAFTRIRGSGPAADPGRVGEAEIGTVATRRAGDGAEGFAAIKMPDDVPVVLKVGATSVLLLGDAVWLTGDVGGVGPAVRLVAFDIGPAEFDIGPALGRGICCRQLRAKSKLTAS